MEVPLSREVVELIARGLPVYAMAPCCLVNVTWADAVRPLIKMALTENVESLVCVQRLIVEANLGSCLNATLLAGGACAALTSAAPGDGQIHVYPSRTALDATACCGPQVLDSALSLPSGEIGDSGKRVIGFAEVPSSSSSSTAREMVGLTVGEELGHGAEVNVWSITGAKKQAMQCTFLEHSSALSGSHQRAVLNGESADDAASANFKCRATHLSTDASSSGMVVLRTLVHNAFEASRERALIAAWDCATGQYVPQASASLCWANPPEDSSSVEEADVENLPPTTAGTSSDAEAVAPVKPINNGDGQGRYGGVDCAVLYPSSNKDGPSNSILVTGHARSADGVVRVRLWDSETGQPANGSLKASTYEACTLPTQGISVAGALSVSLSEDWVVASCADGRVYVWDRKTTNTMAVLASQGVLASAPVAQKEEQGGTSSGAAATVMMAGLAPSELPPPPPSRAAAETCTAVALQGGYLVCAFALTLGRSKVSFKSRRKKEVRMAVFKLQRSVHNHHDEAQRRPSPLLLFPVKKSTTTTTPRVASFCGLLPELAVFEKPKEEAAEDGTNQDSAQGTTTMNAPPAAAAQASTVAEWSVLGGEVRVNKLSLDLERRGKILVACGANGSNQNGEPIGGFLAEYDFLHTDLQPTVV